VLSVSDEIDGEDGLVEFDGTSEDGKVFYDGLGLTLTSGPLARVDVSAEYTWTQQARGNVDLTGYLVGNWPNEAGYAIAGHISSFTFTADSWPQAGAGIGDGWEVAEATAIPHDDLTVVSTTRQTEGKINWWDGSSTSTTFSESISAVASGVPLGSITFPGIVTQDSVSVSYGGGGEDSEKSLSGTSRSFAATLSFLPLYHSRTTLTAAYTANRQCTEKVTFSLYADVQPILTDPDDGEALQIADVKSANLSEPLSGGDVPIGDPRRRSYIATERGNRSLEHLIALARANLLKRARVVEIAFAPKLARMPEITLRKNAFLAEPRVGEAVGKIIGYSLALDGADGQVKCEVRIGCAIGRGGAVAAVAGEPTYCTVDYAGADYQQFTGRVVLLDPADTSVGYEPPASDPNDDGIEFASPLTAADVIDTPLSVENPPAAQRAHIMALMPTWDIFARIGNGQQNVGERDQAVKSALDAVPTKATFKLKSMTRDFSTDYQITLTDLKIPTGYDLEAS